MNQNKKKKDEAVEILNDGDYASVELLDAVECLLDVEGGERVDCILERRFVQGNHPTKQSEREWLGMTELTTTSRWKPEDI